ncbi:MAG: Rne/Rng family ribonuclease, partial [Muribaculaceae bacterium]|nr:Rne/Rng family ribonuclease [Muribaculaceae bacterium]
VAGQGNEVSSALREDGRLVSLQKEARNIAYAVGDIYLAKVKKLMPGLNAAFVNVGYEKDAFLHYLDLGSHFASYSSFLKQLLDDRKRLPKIQQMKILPDIDKHGSIAETLTSGQQLLVQIVKEPISSKGPRLTTEISFTGRFLVLTPFSDKISISQKIKSAEEKMRLRSLVESIKPRNFGVIVRTSAEGKKVAELNHELKTLVQAFEDACVKAQRAEAPALVFEEENRVVGMLRDVFSPSFENIYVNDPDIHEQIVKYVTLIAPERRDIVKLYSKDMPIFDNFSVTRQIKSSFGKTVSFKSGAYIIIEHTEALHVIDVNSGNRSKATNDQETNALEVNLRAADEIARQLRLRDMGGIIVVDFIDMAKAEHRQQLYDHMREIMANDRARHNILPLSKFGLMQITRQRVRPALDVHVAEKCPSCMGTGEVQPSVLFTDTLREKLDYLVTTMGLRDFVMYVHPFVDAYIKKGLLTSLYGKWRRALGRRFKILPDESLAYLQYRVVDKDRKEISLVDEKDAGQSSASKAADKKKRGEEPGADAKTAKAKTEPKQKSEAKPKPELKAKPEQKSKPKPEPKPEPETVAKAGDEADSRQTNVEEPQPRTSDTKPKQKTKAKAKPKDNADAALDLKQLPAAPSGEDSGIAAPVEGVVTESLPVVEEPAETPESQSADIAGLLPVAEDEEPATQEQKKRRRRRRRKPKTVTETSDETSDVSDSAEAADADVNINEE